MEQVETWSGVGKFAVMREGVQVPPNFARTFEEMRDSVLLEEIELGLGGDDFQEAARAEAESRGLS